mmetsp:Transcript_12447/g.23254  ORF Transcript_12447/g.23254 Transcript_12447/m.23254 type:complete len:250 (-) Transcript_12447:791-1540(-)
MDAQLEVFGKRLVKLGVCVWVVFRQVAKHFQAFLHEVLANHAEDLVLLQRLSRNIEGKVFRVHHALNKLEPFRHEFLTIVHDKDTSDIEFNIVPFFRTPTIKHIKRSSFRCKEHGLELKLSLHRKVLHCCMLFPVVGDGFVKGDIFIIRYFIGLAHPEWFRMIKMFPFMVDFLDFLCSLLLVCFFIVVRELFDFWPVVVVKFHTVIVILVLIVGNFFFGRYFCIQKDRKAYELRMPLDQVFDTLFFQVF